jgi:diadenosine tetraphosphatase ApaH/serine/threonine PP2A family protein phosphatase
MHCLVLADVHASLAALEAVLADAGAVDALWCLGDLVDLGPAPEACVSRLRGLGALCVRGNHDLAAGPETRRVPLVRESLAWTRQRLAPETSAWLEQLPHRLEAEGITLTHDVAEGGHTRAPLPEDFAKVGPGGLLVGHFHLPFVLRMGEPDGRTIGIGETIQVRSSIVNPGPVGVSDWQPGWAAYGLLDTSAGTMEIRGIEVDVASTEEEIARLDAPPRLVAYWRRLAADAAQASGQLDRARELFRLSAPAFDEPADARQVTMLVVGAADLVRRAGDPERAATLLGTVGGREAEHPVVRHRVALAEAALRHVLGDAAFASARARGESMALHEALSLGLAAAP